MRSESIDNRFNEIQSSPVETKTLPTSKFQNTIEPKHTLIASGEEHPRYLYQSLFGKIKSVEFSPNRQMLYRISAVFAVIVGSVFAMRMLRNHHVETPHIPCTDNSTHTITEGNFLNNATFFASNTFNSTLPFPAPYPINTPAEILPDVKEESKRSPLDGQAQKLLQDPASAIPSTSSPWNLKDYLAFTKDLNPKVINDALKICTGVTTIFDLKAYEQDKEHYLKQVYNQLAKKIHPDKCPAESKDSCGTALRNLETARDTLANPSNALCVPALYDIDETIRQLDFAKADYQLLACLFPFEAHGPSFGFSTSYSPGSGENEMRRRAGLLSGEQIGGMIAKLGIGRTYITDQNGATTGSLTRFLTAEQLDQGIGFIDFSTIDQDNIYALFERFQSEVSPRRIKLLTTKQIDAIMNRLYINQDIKYSISVALEPQQLKSYIQSIDIKTVNPRHFDSVVNRIPKTNFFLLTNEQAKDTIERFGSKHSHYIRELSSSQIEFYIKTIDMQSVDKTLFEYILNLHQGTFNLLSEAQIKEGNQRFGEYYMEMIKSTFS